MLTVTGANMRTRVTGDTSPIRLMYTDASGDSTSIAGFTFALTVDPNENPASSASNLFTVAGTIVDSDRGEFRFALTQEQADRLVTLPGNIAYWAWVTVTDAGGKVERAKMRLPIAGGPGTSLLAITGLGGIALTEGQVVSGEANLRAISVTNGLVKVTYERPSELTEYPACHLYLKHEGAWLRCVTEQYGDWSFFVNPISATCDRAVVIEANEDAIEVSFEWLTHNLNTGYLGTPGLNERNPSGALNFFDTSPTPHRITESYTRKVIRVERGLAGYFLAWRSKPEMTPEITAHSQGLNNDKDHAGEREFGTGNGSAVCWASTGRVAYFPAWRAQRDWSAVLAAIPSFNNFAWWPGIDDPPYSPWSHATVIAMQPAGYPAHQTSGRVYLADIPVSNYGGSPNIVRVLAMKNPHEAGTWCYAGQSGTMLTHLANAWVEADGRRTRFPQFLGAIYHVPDATTVAKAGYTGAVAFGNEPTAAIQATVNTFVDGVIAAWPT